MPASPRETVLCRYHYDPLDRLADCALSAQADIQRFYCKSRLATEIQGAVQTSIFQHDDQLLAQLQRQDAKLDTTLLATDQQRSVLNALDATQPHPLAYTPYGHRPQGNGLLSLLGFNGERPDPVTGHYHLGNGYRQFNPVLMRFNSPDSWSPFGEGGLNAYGYCGGEPRNRMDETGHFWRGISKFFGRMFGTVPKKMPKTANPVSAVVSSPAASSGVSPENVLKVHETENISTLVTNTAKGSPENVIKPTPPSNLRRTQSMPILNIRKSNVLEIRKHRLNNYIDRDKAINLLDEKERLMKEASLNGTTAQASSTLDLQKINRKLRGNLKTQTNDQANSGGRKN